MIAIVKKIIQFAVVTHNADNTVKSICDILNVGPLKVWDFKNPAIFDTTVGKQSQPWTMKLAFGWLSNMQFEIIEPTSGNSLYKVYLDKNKQAGIQHLLIDRGTISYPDMKKKLADVGMPIHNEAKTNVAVKIGFLTLPPLPMFLAKSMSTIFGYTSTLDTLKTVIETSKYPPGIKPRQGIKMGVPTYWSEGDKQNFEQLPENSLITDIEGFIILVKNIEEVKPHYQKLFGNSTSPASNELFYPLETNFVNVIQPESGTVYEKIMNERGEGIQILVATSRQKSKEKNDAIFLQKGFEVINLDETTTLFTHGNMPFQIVIKL
jgi:hypothetical protein